MITQKYTSEFLNISLTETPGSVKVNQYFIKFHNNTVDYDRQRIMDVVAPIVNTIRPYVMQNFLNQCGNNDMVAAGVMFVASQFKDQDGNKMFELIEQYGTTTTLVQKHVVESYKLESQRTAAKAEKEKTKVEVEESFEEKIEDIVIEKPVEKTKAKKPAAKKK